MNPLIYVIDDDPSFRLLLERTLSKDFRIQTFAKASECLRAMETCLPALVLTDYTMPDLNGVELTSIIRQRYPSVAVIVLTGYGSVESAVEALKAGAFHYIEKTHTGAGVTANFTVLRTLISRAIESVSLREETARYKSEVEHLKRKVREADAPELIGNSPAIQALRQMVQQVAQIDSTVLIRGETGTGKTVVARLIHRLSPREATGEFVEINCAAIPENLLEAELFGYEPGAFTDARTTKKGLFEVAHRGTIFLDEIDATSLVVQSKLLSVLETRTFRRLGGNQPIRADVRVIAATNAKIEEKVAEQKFREDLFFRINVVSIQMPPLRELGEDIILIAEKFLSQFSREMNKPIAGLSESAKAALRQHTWKGNVRELRNVIERAVIFTAPGEWIQPAQLALSAAPMPAPVPSVPQFTIPIGTPLETVKLAYIQAVLKECSSFTEAAKMLGISTKALWEIRKRYNIDQLNFSLPNSPTT
ncbi:MAG: sigma-54 dependent transcriptional regulator [Chloroherpetonaceae bacterium]|nr:sigma-54 dependent transcriptional regulator [Chloroherpetonaceae bacterium]